MELCRDLLARMRVALARRAALGAGNRKVIDHLQVQPELASRAKIARETQRGISAHRARTVTAQNVTDPRRRNSERQGERVGRTPQGLHELLAQNFAGMRADARHSLASQW